MPLSPLSQFKNIIVHFPEFSSQQSMQIEALYDIYNFYNQKVNLISRKDMVNFYIHHVLHSLAVLKVWKKNIPRKIIDLGSGGGFPGIPLCIALPETKIILLDASKKKMKILKEIVLTLNLKNTAICNERIECCSLNTHTAIARGLAEINQIIRWTKKIINYDPTFCQSGLYLLKGGQLDKETAKIPSDYSIDYHAIASFFPHQYFKEKYILKIFKQ